MCIAPQNLHEWHHQGIIRPQNLDADPTDIPMPFQLIGLNHQTAPIAIREKLSFAPDELPAALADLKTFGVPAALILSTCNRTEFLLCDHANRQDPAQFEQLADKLYAWLDSRDVDTAGMQAYLYRHDNLAAIQHSFRVASGLDSMILGEPQILGQLKDAHDAAQRAEMVDTLLGRWLDASYSTAKQVRHDTQLGAQSVSVAYTAVSLATQIFANLHTKHALLIGAGETIELVAKHLIDKGVQQLTIANRTRERAQSLANALSLNEVNVIQLDDIPAHLPQADLIITSTAAPDTLIDKAQMRQSLKARRHRPVFIADLAVPRDVAEAVTELEDVYLYTVDDLQAVIAENWQARQAAAQQGERLVNTAVEHFQAWYQSLDAVELIRQLRDNVQRDRDDVLLKAQRLLAAGKPADEVLQFIANTLTNKFLHNPSSQLREASASNDAALLDAAQQLFNLRDTH